MSYGKGAHFVLPNIPAQRAWRPLAGWHNAGALLDVGSVHLPLSPTVLL